MSRPRRPDDWGRDLDGARGVEEQVRVALDAHPSISHVSDFTAEMDALDFEFRFERATVRVDVKAKWSRSSAELAAEWPDVPADELFVLDETCFRTLLWNEGLGYLLIRDERRSRWHVFGPWELCLGPRRRFERAGDKGSGEFLKGKLLLDLRAAAASTTELSVDALLDVVRSTRAALHQVRGVRVPGEDELPVIPRARASSPEPGAQVEALPRPPEPAAVTAVDATWAGLSVELVEQIRRRWGWESPTAVQRAAFPAALAKHNTLVLGPTAGGKTEAALLPLLDLWRAEGWAGQAPSILVISPLRALIDDQLERWRRAGALVGATTFAWHGDVAQDARRAFKDNPSDALLTTPESLELLLTSPGHDERRLFAGLRAVVIDEAHAFAGTPRGAQLMSLLERLQRFVDEDLQRIGLSATIANPDEVLDWLRGSSLREHEVVGAASPVQGEELALRTYEDLPEAIATIGTAMTGARALVFVRSRRRAEELSQQLGIGVHHGSLSGEGRSEALDALVSGRANALVATATLEMGIDVGDLDLVVHDGAPSSPSSYLQRLGRSGRTSGRRRLTFTIGEPDDLLLTLAVLARVRRGDLGRIPIQRGARLVLGQQALALVLQSFVSNVDELVQTLRWTPVFAGLGADIEATVEHLVAGRWLQRDGDRVVVGPEGQRRFGGTHQVAALLATFKTGALARAVDEQGRHIANVDWNQLERSARSGDGITLAGRPWTVLQVDRVEEVAVLRAGGAGRAPSWRGPTVEVERATWLAVREVLAGTEIPVEMDDRAKDWLAQSRQSWRSRLENPVRRADGATVIDTFAGIGVHRAVLAMLAVDGTADGPTLTVRGPTAELRAAARHRLDDLAHALESEARRVAPELPLAHPELVAPGVLEAEAAVFHVDAEGITAVLEMLAGD